MAIVDIMAILKSGLLEGAETHSIIDGGEAIIPDLELYGRKGAHERLVAAKLYLVDLRGECISYDARKDYTVAFLYGNGELHVGLYSIPKKEMAGRLWYISSEGMEDWKNYQIIIKEMLDKSPHRVYNECKKCNLQGGS